MYYLIKYHKFSLNLQIPGRRILAEGEKGGGWQSGALQKCSSPRQNFPGSDHEGASGVQMILQEKVFLVAVPVLCLSLPYVIFAYARLLSPAPAAPIDGGDAVDLNGAQNTSESLDGGTNGITTTAIGLGAYAPVATTADDGCNIQVIDIADPDNQSLAAPSGIFLGGKPCVH